MSENKLNSDQFDKLSDIFKVLFNRPDLELNDNLTAKDVPGWDSFNHVNLIINIEEEFGVNSDDMNEYGFMRHPFIDELILLVEKYRKELDN